MGALEGEALAVEVESARTFPLIVDLYGGTLSYLERQLCFLALNFVPFWIRPRQAGSFRERHDLNCSVGLPFPAFDTGLDRFPRPRVLGL